jgi:hypothetical protein
MMHVTVILSEIADPTASTAMIDAAKQNMPM